MSNLTLSGETIELVLSKLSNANHRHGELYPGESTARQPVHTVYGGAHLFRKETVQKVGALALQSFQKHAKDPQQLVEALSLERCDSRLADALHAAVLGKVTADPVEDYRVDFEDGYGIRTDEEEDRDAVAAADAFVAAMESNLLSAFSGIRVKSLATQTADRSIRTLDLFLTRLTQLSDKQLPSGFVITLPKPVSIAQVECFIDVVESLERKLVLPEGILKTELMIESPHSIVDSTGRLMVAPLVAAGRGRCRGVHFGAYDYTAACDVVLAEQSLSHPQCDFARTIIKSCLSGTGVWLSDGATTVIPTEPHKPVKGAGELTREQELENRSSVHKAWRLSARDIERSLSQGFYQGWDLHPAQIPIRYGVVFHFFLRNLPDAAARFKAFLGKAAQATLSGSSFDDAATGQGMLNFFLRGLSCGAFSDSLLVAHGLNLDKFESRSFVKILQAHREKESLNA
ncbi:MAG: hypothetical protein K2W95_03355 [Candidatus Obscuribacterales bacterium]|nr:hypothetical protein [Candidatus Obscuribacterales bacterium]